MSELLLDRAGRRRAPATMPGFHAGRPPHNKGLRYPADPPKVEEIIAVMRAAGDHPHGRRLRALIVLLWRAGLRIHEALALTEGDLDQRRGSLLIRHGKGGRAAARSAWTRGDGTNSGPGSSCGPSFRSVPCCASSTARRAVATGRPPRHARSCGARRPPPGFGAASRRTNCATPTPSRWPAKGVPLIVIQRQLGHSNLGITSVYLQGIDSGEVIETVHARRAPMIPVSESVRL
jgi:integrase